MPTIRWTGVDSNQHTLSVQDKEVPTVFPMPYRLANELSDLRKGVGCTRIIEYTLDKNFSPDGVTEKRSIEPYHWALKLSSDGTRVEILSDLTIKSGSTIPFSYKIVATNPGAGVVTAALDDLGGWAAPEFLSINLSNGVLMTGTASVSVFPYATLASWECH